MPTQQQPHPSHLNPNVTVDIALPPKPVQRSRSLLSGLTQIIFQSTPDAGEIRLTARADGLTPAATAVHTQPCTPVGEGCWRDAEEEQTESLNCALPP